MKRHTIGTRLHRTAHCDTNEDYECEVVGYDAGRYRLNWRFGSARENYWSMEGVHRKMRVIHRVSQLPEELFKI